MLKELKNGSSFEGQAREVSIDTSSASLGGDIGYITEETTAVDPALVQQVSSIKEGTWSEVISLQDGRYAVLYVKDIFEGQAFSFNEVKDHIKRDLALSQFQSVTQEFFWKEFDAEWLYGEE